MFSALRLIFDRSRNWAGVILENRVNPIMVVVVDLAVNGHKHLIYIPEHAHVSAFFFESSVETILAGHFPRDGPWRFGSGGYDWQRDVPERSCCHIHFPDRNEKMCRRRTAPMPPHRGPMESYVSAGLESFAVGFPIRPTRETTLGFFARRIVPDVAPSSRFMTVDSWPEVTNALIPRGVSTTPLSFASTSRKKVNSCSVHTVSALGKNHRLARHGSNLSTVNGRPALAHCRCQ